MSDSDCVFCKIVAGELPCHSVYEDDKTLAFLDIEPQEKGHTLIIPKQHTKDLLEADDDTIGRLVEITKRLAEHYKNQVAIAGFSIVTNIGVAQDVPHLHVQLIPKYKESHVDESTDLAAIARELRGQS